MASSNRFTLTITGKKTHAAYPHTGVDPIPVAAQVINALQTIPSRMNNAAEPIVVSVGTINGGNRFNIIADAVTLTGTVRTLAKDGPERVKALMERAIKGVTEASGATYAFDFLSGNPVTYNEETLATASLPILADVMGGRTKILAPPPQMGAEDFAMYQQRIPGLFFFLGVGNTEKKITAMIHTEYFDMDEDALPIGVRALAGRHAGFSVPEVNGDRLRPCVLLVGRVSGGAVAAPRRTVSDAAGRGWRLPLERRRRADAAPPPARRVRRPTRARAARRR